MGKKKIIILVVFLLAVGFATVTSVLYINGSINYGTNIDDFEVYYSDVNGKYAQDIIEDYTHIRFGTTMKSVGEKYVVDYGVTNGSRNYDATLIMECTGSNEYISVTNDFDTSINLPATETRRGRLTVELVKGYVGEEDKKVTIECSINANAVARSSLSNGIPVKKPNISFTLPEV